MTVVGEPYWWTLLVNPISEPYWWKLIMNLIHEPYMYTPEIQQSIMLLLSQKFDNLIWQPYSWTLFMNLVCTLQKFNKASCCIVTWIMPDIWLKLDFSCCLKKKLVTNLLGYFLAQFQRFSRGYASRKSLKLCVKIP